MLQPLHYRLKGNWACDFLDIRDIKDFVKGPLDESNFSFLKLAEFSMLLISNEI